MTAQAFELLIAAANAFVGLEEEGGENRGQMVELFLRNVGQPPGQPWCAALVYHVGYWSQYDHVAGGSRWPLPKTASCWELGDFARRRGMLESAPNPGDVFLRYSHRAKRFNHTGIVISIDRVQGTAGITRRICTCIEGNTNDDGSVNGHSVLRRLRGFGPRDRFIRWTRIGQDTRAA